MKQKSRGREAAPARARSARGWLVSGSGLLSHRSTGPVAFGTGVAVRLELQRRGRLCCRHEYCCGARLPSPDLSDAYRPAGVRRRSADDSAGR